MNETTERWITITNYPDYQVSDCGNVRNLLTGKILKPCANKIGYAIVNLYKDHKAKSYSVHLLVANAFLKDSWFPGAEVDHINNDKMDNRLENLLWITHIDNMRKRQDFKQRDMSNIMIPLRCIETGVVYPSITTASLAFGRKKDVFFKYLAGKIKSVAGGYHFEKVDKKQLDNQQ